ncbi:MAG: MotA/TolQ/ExbB proton channel family protein [Mariprofundaceae bacterium]|nr:MotA/TolQ/ExbB proton channel family protein [Mariprofundaceae bacterium]
MDLTALINQGGPVMWVLLAYSVIACAIVFERLFQLQRLPNINHQIQPLDLLEGHKNSPEVIIVTAVQQASSTGIQDLTRVATRVGSEQLVRMESGLRSLAWMGNTAPLLGLFGTITGLIKDFQVIESAGGKVNAQMLAGGIWEAMITTGAGLAVAIPILLALHFLEGMVDKRTQSMQRLASLLIEQLPHHKDSQLSTQIHHQHSVSHAV